MEENLGAFEEKRNEAAETAESAGKGGKHLAKGGKRGWAIAGIALGVLAAAYLGLCAYATLSGTIYPNTTVGGVNYGGMTEEQVAAELTRREIPTPYGYRIWNDRTVKNILKNEKYRGDALLQKRYSRDFLDRQMRMNTGEAPQY